MVREAYAAGQELFGESLRRSGRSRACRPSTDIEWHFIGHLQTNKARVVAKHAHVVHTVDSASLAKELASERRRTAALRVAYLCSSR